MKVKTFFIAIIVMLTSFVVFSQDTDDEIFTFENKRGVVTFNHTAHQMVWECSSCHPAFPEEYNDDISIKNEAHKSCKACHKEVDAGPVSCNGCHVKSKNFWE